MDLDSAPIWRKITDHTIRFRAMLNEEGTHYLFRRLDRDAPDGQLRRDRWETLYELEPVEDSP